MANNRKKTPTVVSDEIQIDTLNNNETPKETKEIKKPKKTVKYTVEYIGKNRVWLRKDAHTVTMLVGSFDYQVGDIVEI